MANQEKREQLLNQLENKFNDIGQDLDNKNEPITELYIGIIKNGGTASKNISTVESNFAPLIAYTNPGEGIMRISEISNTEVSDKPDIGTVYDIGIYEYSLMLYLFLVLQREVDLQQYEQAV